MPDNFNAAAAILKGQAGLPHGDVNQQAAAPSPAAPASRQPVQNISVSQQNENAAKLIANLGENQGTQTDPMQEALRIKDQAIQDAAERVSAMEAAMQSQTEKLAAVLDRYVQPKAQNTPTEEPLPSLPADLNVLPADQVIQKVQEYAKNLGEAVDRKLKKRDELLNVAIPPLVKEVRQMKEAKERNDLLTRFPKFDWNKRLPEMQKLMAQLPGMTYSEAAKVVADPSELQAVEDRTPMTEPSMPSSRTAASARPGSHQQASQSEENSRDNLKNQLRGLIVDSHARGLTSQARELSAQLLKMKLGIS